MLYTIAEVSELINLSKVSIYKKLKLKELEKHISKKQGITCIDEVGLNFIKESLKFNKEVKSALKDIDDFVNDETAIDNDYTFFLKDEIDFLKNEIQEKNLQISSLNNRLGFEQDLHKNTQILLKNQQDKPKEDILFLENRFKELDIKLIEVVEHMKQKKEDQKSKSKTGFLKWFKYNL